MRSPSKVETNRDNMTRVFKKLLLLTVIVAQGCAELVELIEENNEQPISTTTITTTQSTTTTTTIPPTPTNPTCDHYSTFFPPDGAGGFLWKPVSESNGNLAVLLPGKFKKQFNKCTVYDGKVADSLRFDKFANPDSYGDRQHWRGNHPGSYYNSPALVVCNDGVQDCAWHISTPNSRID